jgi:hypothetical protein
MQVEKKLLLVIVDIPTFGEAKMDNLVRLGKEDNLDSLEKKDNLDPMLTNKLLR